MLFIYLQWLGSFNLGEFAQQYEVICVVVFYLFAAICLI